MIKTIVAATLLLVSSVASAVMVDVNDNFYSIYNPNDTYNINVVLGGPEIFTFGFGFTDPTHQYGLTFNIPASFIGPFDFAVTSGPDVTGLYYFGGSLLAGQSATYSIAGGSTAAVSRPVPIYVSLQAPNMPPLTSYPGVISSVPIPAAVWLFGSGLLGLVGVARRKSTTV